MNATYIFFSEAIHFGNIFIGNACISSLPLLGLIIAAGISFRFTVTTKNLFYLALGSVFIVWLVGQIIYSYVLINDLINYLNFSQPFFNINWLWSTFFFTASITHIILRILRKRPLV